MIRSEHNPILIPDKKNSWEAQAVFNGCPIRQGKEVRLLYRALSMPHYQLPINDDINVSNIGIARSVDGYHFTDRKRFIVPEEPWERFGCEDPRVTYIDGSYFVFYTALSEYPFRAEGIKVGLAISDDLERVREKHLVTPFNAKGMTLFPERIGGKLWALLTVDTDSHPSFIGLASFDTKEEMISPAYWEKWYREREKHHIEFKRAKHIHEDHVEVGAPPVKTDKGWLVFYSHMRNYFTGNALFTVEAVLLDLKDPRKIIGRTEFPLIVPEEHYERYGIVPNIVFPSGALVSGKRIELYYGAADTVCAIASASLPDLLENILTKKEKRVAFKRRSARPIMEPIVEHAWESKATFNPAALRIGDTTHIVYRAMSEDNTSVMGYATTDDGIHVKERLPEPIYTPRASFEDKKVPGGNSGCEDPRLSLVEDTVYMTYTAYDGVSVPRIALTSISKKDFLAHAWQKWQTPMLISPPGVDDKDSFVFPEKVNGKYLIIHRSGVDIDLAWSDDLSFGPDDWLEEYRWIQPRKGWWDSRKVGAVSPPHKTTKGWIFLYHGISDDGIYRVGAILLDKKDPTKVLARTAYPIFEPEMLYEKEGIVPNVVFPCGSTLQDDTMFIYYGGADKVLNVASISVDELLGALSSPLCREI
ncbi:MAG: hypothetical protein HGA67_00870 [Candidatus Yonathbacteria bacterium]|nr:hypothetical protein [Candidatus Yonathbacteria bacterium]